MGILDIFDVAGSSCLPWKNFPALGEDGRCGDRRPLLLERVLGQATVQRAPLAADALEPGHEVQGALWVGGEHLVVVAEWNAWVTLHLMMFITDVE